MRLAAKILHNDANSQADCHNKGYFKAILEFRAKGNQLLQKHITKGQ
jgi:hypothetical protein